MNRRWTNACVPAAVLAALLAGGVRADAGADLAQADKYMAGHRYAEALAVYERVLPLVEGEQAHHAQQRIAYCHQRLWKGDTAIAEYARLLAMPGLSAERQAAAWTETGYLHALARRHEEAVACYDKAEAIEGISGEAIAGARLRKGQALNALGQVEASFETLVSIAALEDVNPAYHQMGLVTAGGLRQSAGRYAEALALYERAAAVGSGGTWATIAANRVVECRAAVAGEPAFYFHPYVSLVGTSQATIFWVSLEDAPAGTVRVTGGGQTFDVDCELTQIADAPAYRQMATVSGLRPYTLYTYEASVGRRTVKGVFHTARDGGGPVRFVVLGDTQTGWQHHTALGLMIADENPDFVLHVGDCVERGTRWDEWKVQMFDPGRPYLAKAPLWVARGNHDGGPYFAILLGREQSPYQSFTFGDLHVMILDSTHYFGSTRGRQQLDWLTQQLQSSTARWRMVALHHPMFHTANGDRLVGQHNFRPAVEELSPDVVINGHYHVYTRMLPIGFPGKKPLINIVTGGGGGHTSHPTTISPMAEVERGGVYHYTLWEIDGDTMTMTAKAVDGSVLDTMTLTKSADGLFQQAVMAKAVHPDIVRGAHMVYHDLQAPGYQRHDLTAEMSLDDSGAARIRLDRNILDVEKLPADTGLIVESTDDSGWDVRRQTLELSSGAFDFVARQRQQQNQQQAQRGGEQQASGEASMRLQVTLKVGDRLFEPRVLDVTLRPGQAE